MRYGELDRFLVPLDAPLARRYFNDALYAPGSAGERVRRALGHPRLRRVSDLGGVEASFDVPHDAAIYLRDYAHSDRGRVVGFFFREGEALPYAVAKTQESRVEGDALEQMRAFLPPALKATLPRVLRFEEALLVVSGVPGRSAYLDMRGSLTPSRYVDAHFAVAAEWLAAFHDATRSRVTSVIDGVEVPHSALHGDFWSRNVLTDARGSVSVVDWEHFVAAGSPFVDLFHYPLTYGLSYPWNIGYGYVEPEAAFRKTFVETNRVSRAVRRYLHDYCDRAGLPHALLAPALREYVETRGRMHEGIDPRPGTADLPWETFADPQSRVRKVRRASAS